MTDPHARAFLWEREPDPSWVARLQGLRSMTDQQTGLVIAWEPGDPWQPVQRWMIYEVFPKVAIPPDVLAQLDGPHPRSTGHPCFGTNEYGTWCQCPNPAQRWVDGPAGAITKTSWLLYHRYGGWARPLWVVQGTKGGHKYRFTQWESRLSKAAGGPMQPKPPGDLIYAEPDDRTWEHIRFYADPDLLKSYRGLVSYGMRRPGDLDINDQRACEFAAKELLKSFGLSVAEHADELEWALKRANFNTEHASSPEVDVEAGNAQTLSYLTETMTHNA